MRLLIGAATIALGFLALWLLTRDLVPPKSLVLAAGPEGGGYWQIARGYREILARDGIDVEVRATSGSVENARLLTEGAVDVALMQGGVGIEADVKSLGALFYEPMFFFARRDAEIQANAARWAGLRFAAGPDGSGTAAAMAVFARAAGIDGAYTHLPLGGADAAAALARGDADIAVFVAPLDAAYLAPLFADDDVGLLRLNHIVALERRMTQTEVVILPSAGITFDPPIPATDLRMLAMVAHLVARTDLHPSLVNRLVHAATILHSGPSAVASVQSFPSTRAGLVPFDDYAAKLIRDGPSPLRTYLPYWVVAQINRFAILILPLLFIVVPLLRAIPAIYSGWMRFRVMRHYAMIREIDVEAQAAAGKQELQALLARLEAADKAVSRLSVPAPYRDMAYTVQVHINLVRGRIERKLEELDAS